MEFLRQLPVELVEEEGETKTSCSVEGSCASCLCSAKVVWLLLKVEGSVFASASPRQWLIVVLSKASLEANASSDPFSPSITSVASHSQIISAAQVHTKSGSLSASKGSSFCVECWSRLKSCSKCDSVMNTFSLDPSDSFPSVIKMNGNYFYERIQKEKNLKNQLL